MRRLSLLLLLLAAAPAPAAAQADDRQAVLALVDRLFAGLKAGDTAAMRAVLHPAARIIQTGTREGTPFARVNSADDFLRSIGAAAGRKLEERTYNPDVRLDDNLATVWVEYDFLVDGAVNHCGVDSYQMVRGSGGWQILQIVDTQRRTGCDSIATLAQARQDRRIDFVEIPVPDVVRAKAFYGRVFGWRFTDYGTDYAGFSDGRLSGGLRQEKGRRGTGVLVVFYAGDLAALRGAVVAAGGRIVREIFDFPGGRRFHFADPAGNELAVWSDR
jgi:predicted enzyme related to lactoylglutathione lyase